MNTVRALLWLAFSLSATACSGPEPPVFGEPVPMAVPAGRNTLGARLTAGSDGTVLISWMQREKQGATLRFSKLTLEKWQPAMDVVSDPQMFVNWADLPSVHPFNDKSWVAHWLSKSADSTYAYDVLLSFSIDAGASWGEAFRPHTDATPTEHGFVSLRPQGDSAALLWLDGRKTLSTATDEPLASSMTLRAAAVAPDGSLSGEQLVDESVCDCCQTDVAISAAGPVAVYRNRTDDEIRDIYVTRFIDGAWTTGVPIADDGWNITGCPVNGPSIDAKDKLVAVAWFSAADDRPVVRAVLSNNAGKTFKAPVEIASTGTSGHVGVAIVDRSTFAVSWVEADKRGTNAINIRGVTTAGQLGPVQMVGRTELRRVYPQLLRSDDQLIVAWTDILIDATKVVAVTVPILGFYDR